VGVLLLAALSGLRSLGTCARLRALCNAELS
jgi:hypothetical protein